MLINHIHFYVKDATETRKLLVDKMGFQYLSQFKQNHTLTEIVTNNYSIFFVISSPLNALSSVAHYLDCHAEGVVDIAFRVNNIDSILNKFCQKDANIILASKTYSLAKHKIKFAKIKGWNCLEHTLIENVNNIPFHSLFPKLIGNDNIIFPEITNYSSSKGKFDNHIIGIDHVVLNVPQGELLTAVNFYQNIFYFQPLQTFKINTNRSGLSSQALVAPQNNFYFNINEPTSDNSQIQEFLNINQGAGIQHIGLKSINILHTVRQMRIRGLPFLPVAKNYYTNLKQKINNGLIYSLTAEEYEIIESQEILIDSNYNLPESLLMQIFTKPIFNQPTFFFELIERRKQAQGFGEGNFQALFEIIEKQQIN